MGARVRSLGWAGMERRASAVCQRGAHELKSKLTAFDDIKTFEQFIHNEIFFPTSA